MNPVLGVIGNLLNGNGNNIAGNAQANSVNTNNINEALGIFGMLKGSTNPMQMLQAMSQKNPNIQKAIEYVKQNGGDAQSAFYQIAKQYGVDPNQVLNMLK